MVAYFLHGGPDSAVFGLAADGKAEVVQTPISEEEKDGARLSAENCPVSVIEAEE